MAFLVVMGQVASMPPPAPGHDSSPTPPTYISWSQAEWAEWHRIHIENPHEEDKSGDTGGNGDNAGDADWNIDPPLQPLDIADPRQLKGKGIGGGKGKKEKKNKKAAKGGDSDSESSSGSTASTGAVSTTAPTLTATGAASTTSGDVAMIEPSLDRQARRAEKRKLEKAAKKSAKKSSGSAIASGGPPLPTVVEESGGEMKDVAASSGGGTIKGVAASSGGYKVLCKNVNQGCVTGPTSWKRMLSTKVWTAYQETLAGPDDKFTFLHTCATCLSKEMNISVPAADAEIVRVWLEPKLARASRFNEAFANKQKEFPVLSKTKLRTLTLANLSEIWEDLAEVILKKVAQLSGLHESSKLIEELTAKLRVVKNTAEAEELKLQIDKAREDNERRDVPLAYADHPDQAAMLMASSYADEFARTSDGAGYFRCWFMCLAGGSTWPCMTVCPSKSWTRRFSDPTASKQRWFCTECSARFKTKFGCLIEIVSVSGVRCFVRATVPDMDVQDIRAMHHERIYQGRDSQQLFDLLPVIPPTTGDLLIPLDPVLGTARIASKELLDALPMFKWESIFTLA